MQQTNIYPQVLLGLSVDEAQLQYYLDLLRLIWYIVGGVLGVTWVLNTFIWAIQLPEDKGMLKTTASQKPVRSGATSAVNVMKKGSQPLQRKIVL
jgi:hypothetical protein